MENDKNSDRQSDDDSDELSGDSPSGAYDGRSPFGPRPRQPVAHRLFPVVGALRGYNGATLRRDVVAGLTVAALALPAGMAFAELAGLPPVSGLYALLLPTVAYALFGTSRQLIIGPEGVTASLVAVTVAPLAPLAAGDPARYIALAATLALVVGAIFLVAWLLRLGWVADYFSRAVSIGYLTGIAFTLVAGQAQKLTGVPVEPGSALKQAVSFVTNIGQIQAATAAVGLSALAALLLLRRFVPWLPGALLLVGIAIVLSVVFGFADHGIATVGTIPAGLPVPQVPDMSAGDIRSLLPGALGVFVVSFSDVILTARAVAGRRGQHIRAGRELLAIGVANLSAGFTQGFSVSSSGSRTAVNNQAGAQTQLAGLVGAGAIAVVLVALSGPMAYLPSAVLGAVIVAAAIALVDVAAWRALVAVARREVMIAVAAALGVITVGVLNSLILAVALSFVDVVMRSARPHDAVLGYVPRIDRWADVSVHPGAEIQPGVVVYRLDGRLFFANAGYVRARIHEAIDGAPTPTHDLVFDAEGVSTIDASGLETLGALIDELADLDITFRLARARHHILGLLEDAGLLVRIGEPNVHPTIRAAARAASRPPE